MKQYARIFNQYKYQMQKRPDDALWPRDGNIGDCIQSLAIENLYRKIGIAVETLTLINRDDIRTYRGGGGYPVCFAHASLVRGLCRCFSFALVG